MATSADLDLNESMEESCALVSSKELAKKIEEASGSSTPTEHAAWLKWARLRLLIFQNSCLTKRRAVACLAAAALVASMVALAATSLGQALAESATGACKLTISVEGVAQCRKTSHANHRGSRFPDLDLGFPIDAVYTWVDPTDLEWRKKRHAAVGGTFGEYGASEPSSREGYFSDARRFNNGAYPDGELCASLQLLQRNMPWIRHVWILTMRPQRPKCVHPRMRVVHHDEVGLPDTFNSRSIETSVHRILGLSERFVYLNDDFYVVKPIPASAFFAADGRPFVFTEKLHFGQLFWRCEHSCEVTNQLVLPLLHGKRMLVLALTPSNPYPNPNSNIP